MISHSGFNLHFSDDYDVKHFFMFTGLLYVLFGEVSIEVFCPFLIVCLAGVELY